MLKQITLTGSLVTLALLSACGSLPSARLSFSERFPYAADFVRQPNGDMRPESEAIRAEAACDDRAAQVRREGTTMFIVASARAPLMTLDGSSNAIDQAAENAFLRCMKAKGWEYVSTKAEADRIAAKARADRLAGR